MTPGRRWASAVALAVVVTLGTVLGAGGMARATTAYRYWAYYVGNDGQWQYSERGPGSQHASDGDVQGWRFGVQSDSGTLVPRAAPAFGTICGSTPAQAGRIRVGLVIDFGTTSDAPPGQHPPAQISSGCVVVPATVNGLPASGLDVLQAAVGAANVRFGTGNDAGMVCGIDGYPKTECAPVVQVGASTPTQAPAAPPAPVPTPGRAKRAAAANSPSSPPTTAAATAATSSQAAPTPSAGSAPASASSPASTSSVVPLASAPLSALRTKGDHHFPTGAVVGGALAVGLAAAALTRFMLTKRAHP